MPGRAGQLLIRHPVAFAALCGLVIAAIGVASDGQTYGTGYEQARGMVEATTTLPASYARAEIPGHGGLLHQRHPRRPVRAFPVGRRGTRRMAVALLPSAPAGAVVLLGMVAYFSGVVQAPITSTVIVMEMTDDQRVTVPLLATAFLAFGVSRLVCHRPLYTALAHRFAAAQQRLPDC